MRSEQDSLASRTDVTRAHFAAEWLRRKHVSSSVRPTRQCPRLSRIMPWQPPSGFARYASLWTSRRERRSTVMTKLHPLTSAQPAC